MALEWIKLTVLIVAALSAAAIAVYRLIKSDKIAELDEHEHQSFHD